jgi:hypothetical protein
MLSDTRFWAGVAAGLIGLYVYHRVKGVPSNAPGSNKGA